jgi:hypothetical protein
VTSACRNYCLEAIKLSERLIQLAHDGSTGCDHDRCLVLFGIILDTGSKIHNEAEKRLKELSEKSHLGISH